MDNAPGQIFPQVSRSGRILKKSARQMEAEESFLREEYLTEIPHRNEDTIHCFDMTHNNGSIEGTKVFDIRLRPDGPNSISLVSLTDKEVTSESFKDVIHNFQMTNDGLPAEKHVIYSKRVPNSTRSTSLSASADAGATCEPFIDVVNGFQVTNNGLMEGNHAFRSTHLRDSARSILLSTTDADETFKSVKNTFRPLDLTSNGCKEGNRLYSKQRLITCSTSVDAGETSRPFQNTFQRFLQTNNGFKEETKICHAPLKGSFRLFDSANNALGGESCSKRRRLFSAPSTSVSSTHRNGAFEAESENSQKSMSTESSSENSQAERKGQDRKDIIDHKYCTRSQNTRSSEKTTVAAEKPANTAFENGAWIRRNNVDAYTLWSSLNRRMLCASNMHLERQDVATKVTEEWNALPPEEKKFWATKAQELSQRIRNHSLNSGCDAGSNVRKNSDCDARLKQKKQMKKRSLLWVPSKKNSCVKKHKEKHVLGITSIDAAAHLKLLGDGLINIGRKILLADQEPSAAGVYSSLLDSLLCSTGALLCLAREIPGLEQLPGASFAKTLDHIAYFMPGISL